MAKIYSSGNTLFIGSDVAPIDSGVVATAVTATGYTDHVQVANAEGFNYVIAPYDEIFEEDGTTNWGTDVTSTVNNLNTLFGNNNPNNYADKTKLDTAVSRINAAEADIATNTSDIATNVLDISDIKKAVQIDLGAGRGIFADDGKGNTKSYLKVADSQAVIQGGVLTRINISEASPGSHSFTVAAGPSGSETEYEALELYGKTTAGTAALELKNGTALSFVNGSYATVFKTETLTAARTIGLPDASGTVALTSDIPSFVGYVDTTGTPANNQVAVFTDQDTIEGSTALIVDGANVGIGTATPNSSLHVRTAGGSTARFESTDNAVQIRIKPYGGNYTNLISDTTGPFYIDANTHIFRSENSNNERVRITSDGNVGIGTTSPSVKLDVAGDIIARDTYPSVYVDHSGTVLGGIRADATNKLEFKTLTTAPLSFQVNSSEKMRITDGGNVGIGTTSPADKLHVVGRANIHDGNANVFISSENSTNGGIGNTAVGRQSQNAGSGIGNTSLGYRSFMDAKGSYNTSIGYEAAKGISTSTFSNTVAVGYQALTALTTGTGNTALGYQAGNTVTTGINNTILGYSAGGTNNSYTTLIGYDANANGNYGVAIGWLTRAGDHSTSIGTLAGGNSANADYNVFIGDSAGRFNNNHRNVFVGRGAGYNSSTASDSVFIGYQAGYSETGSNKLYIENSNSTTPLIYGEFDNDIVRVNGDFKVRLPGESNDSLSVGETIVLKPSDNSYVPSSNNAAVYIDRDGSTSTDVVALHIGDKLKIKRNGGGTPTFDVDNGAFIYTQNYNGYTATNTNPFNNGSGMGIRNTTPGSPVICALLINGVFGALNTAGSTLNIGNPNGCNNNWAQAQSVSFRNTSFFGVRRGEESNYGAEDGYVIRHQDNNTDSVSDYRNGLQLSATPNIGVSTNNGRVYATNGSNVLNADTLGFDVRSFVTVGDILYIDETAGTSLGTSWAVHTVTAVDSVNETITIDSNWAGTTGTVGAWIERNIVTVRNWDGDVMTRVKGTGEFQIGNDSAGYKLPSTDGTASQVLSTDGSGNVTWVDTTLEGLPNVVSALTNNEILTYNSTLGYWVGGNSVTLNSVNTNNLTVNSSATFSSAISAPSFLLTSDGESEISVGVLSDDLALKSAGNVRVLLDKDNNETGQKFLVEDPSSTERFSVDDAGVATFNNAYSLPNADGTSGQVLTTNGSGAASWADAGGGGKSSSASGYLEIKSDSMTQLFVGPTNGIFAADYTTGNNDNQSYSHNGTAPTAGSSTISKYPYNVRSGLLDVHHDISTISFNARLRDVSQNAASCEYWVCIWHLSGGAAETFTSQTWTAAAVGTGTFGASSVNTLLSKVVATASGLSISAGDSLWITFGWVDQPAGTPDIPVNWSINMNE